MSDRKADAFLFLDVSNVFCTAAELGVWVDLERLILSLSEEYLLRGLFAFASTRVNHGLVEALYNMGFTVFQTPYNADALMGFKIGELTRNRRVDVVFIATHDGDFKGICDELEQESVQVCFLGFRNRFSTFLKPKQCIFVEDLDVLSPRINVAPCKF